MAQNFLTVKADVAQVQAALAGTSKSLKSIQRQALGAIGRGAVKRIKSVIRQTTARRTGELAKAYGYKVAKDGSRASVFPRSVAVAANNHLILAKISALSYGAEISARRNFLQVNGRGYYARPKSVTIAPRGFVQAGEAYVQDGTYQGELERLVEKELLKYWGT